MKIALGVATAVVIIPFLLMGMLFDPGTFAVAGADSCSVSALPGVSSSQLVLINQMIAVDNEFGATPNGLTDALLASLAMTDISNESESGAVGPYGFDPAGNWGPSDVLSSSNEDTVLFYSALLSVEAAPTDQFATTVATVLDNNLVAPQSVTTTNKYRANRSGKCHSGDAIDPTSSKFCLHTTEALAQPPASFFQPYVDRAVLLTAQIEFALTPVQACGGVASATVGGIVSGEDQALPLGYSIPTSLSAQRREVLEAAEAEIGYSYIWGAADPGVAFDCSGLTMWAWGEASPPVSLDHYTVSQWQETTPLPSLTGALPGDLVLVPGSDGSMDPPNPQHVGIYIGVVNGVPYVESAADQELGVIVQTYSSFISGGLIAVGHVKVA